MREMPIRVSMGQICSTVDKEANLGQTAAAASESADFIVFPEFAM